MHFRCVFLAGAAALLALPAFATTVTPDVVISAYDPTPSTGSDPALTSGPGAPAVGVTPSDLSRGTGLSAPATLPGNNYNSVGFGATSASGAISSGDFLLWGFTSTKAYDLSYLAINYGRTNGGPANQQIDISIDGGSSFQTIHTSTLGSGSSQQYGSIDLNSYDGVTSAIFRLVGWNATNTSTGRLSVIDTVDFVNGTNAGLAVFGTASAAVPLPASLVMLGGALGLLGAVARRRLA